MKIPNYEDFLQVTLRYQTVLSRLAAASADNQFGEHHVFGMKSSSCPLLRCNTWRPRHASFSTHNAYVKQIAEREKQLNYDKRIYGDPKESQYDLMTKS